MPATSFVTHLEAAIDGTVLPARTIQTTHESRPLWVRYDLDAVSRAVSRADLRDRPPTLWRYRELLPVDDDSCIVSLGEGMTPLLDCPRLASRLGIDRLLIKDESQLPTGSFKCRGMTVAVSMARQFGIERVAVPTAGNAGGALAAYAARAGMECWVFMPVDTPEVNKAEARLFGAHAFQIDGLITDCARVVQLGKERMRWFDMSTLKEPYRIEGKKTMGLELAEQFAWELPDVIFYPTGGGTGLIGMWKAFAELEEIGFIGPARPRMVVVQAAGCAPMVRAYEQGLDHAELWENPHTIASGIRVPAAIGDFLILRAVRESSGFAIAVDDDAIAAAQAEAARIEGLLLCPEGAATLAAYQQACADGRVGPGERALLFNCATGLKYPMPPSVNRIDCRAPIDWASL